ncbi:MAG TPA: hypothetical protein VFQ22_05455 [Longimicrobiales bacterium]|nr:hypothetical protein [Longimicrobiales bacterium]
MRRWTLPDLILVLGAAALVLALLQPTRERRAFDALVERAVADVERVASAARRTLAREGSWPASAAPGAYPPELVAAGVPDSVFSRAEYSLAWRAFDVVDTTLIKRVEALPQLGVPLGVLNPPPPRAEPVVATVGAVALRSDRDELLAAVYDRLPEGRRFLLDGLVVLVLPERGAAGSPAAPGPVTAP